ncbi:hypothetical protein EYC84_010932 [Monilinia fructicola]|uniref:Uncharacterized protein n=1 Tax=Monilinia fructicola TaxID=38448 RepID=A0A5M9JD98_MONFR|nr:hypothetical protein EYC84_010932 [Monilinia fructicola]
MFPSNSFPRVDPLVDAVTLLGGNILRRGGEDCALKGFFVVGLFAYVGSFRVVILNVESSIVPLSHGGFFLSGAVELASVAALLGYISDGGVSGGELVFGVGGYDNSAVGNDFRMRA